MSRLAFVSLALIAISCSGEPTLGSKKWLSRSEDNWAVIVSTSRYWFNYRHTSNALIVYEQFRRLGFPDSHIILMLAEDHGNLPRNPFPGSMPVDSTHPGAYLDDMEVDFRGLDVTPEVLEALIAGDNVAKPGTDASPGIFIPPHKRLNSNNESNVVLYLTGHGGEGFLKFHDRFELKYSSLAESIDLAQKRGRFQRLLLIADTCKAASALKAQKAPGVFGIASSSRGEDSYSLTSSDALGVSTADGFTYYFAGLLSTLPAPTNGSTFPRDALEVESGRSSGLRLVSIQQFFNKMLGFRLKSTVRTRSDLLGGAEHVGLDKAKEKLKVDALNRLRTLDFFGFRARPPPRQS